MTQETSYTSETDRLLNELVKPTASSTRLPALNDSEQEALQKLLEQAVAHPKDSEDCKEKPRSPRMTHQDLKAMKSVTQQVDNPKTTVLRKCSQFFFVFSAFLKGAFSPR